MWLNILKYVVKAAIATGLADKGKEWLKKKILKSAGKAEKKVDKIIADIEVSQGQ